jgi:hypothetical protein
MPPWMRPWRWVIEHTGATIVIRVRKPGPHILWIHCLAIVAAATICLCAALAQHHLPELHFIPAPDSPAVDASSEFIFARVQYTHANGGALAQPPGWKHSYPAAEQHILQLAREITGVNLSSAAHTIVRLGSPELFRYPFVYFTEVGEMHLTDREISNFHEYLNRGGFAMVDDFDGQESLDTFEREMERILPGRRSTELRPDHPVFHTFYDIATLNMKRPYTHSGGGTAAFLGYEDDHGRLCVVVNHNNNLGAYWSMMDQPRYPLGPSTQSVRFGVDYFLYSLTH